MLQIPCPHCGTRDYTEFEYGGSAARSRPTDDEGWQEYLYLRENPDGPHSEHWFHRHGCRSWLTVERDTSTNVITGVGRPAGERP